MSDAAQPAAPNVLDDRESQLAAREAAVAKREAAADAREAAHNEREARLKAREDALSSVFPPAVPEAPVAEESSASLQSVQEGTEEAPAVSDSVPVEESRVEGSAPTETEEALQTSESSPAEENPKIDKTQDPAQVSSQYVSEAKGEEPEADKDAAVASESSPAKEVKFQEPESVIAEEKLTEENKSDAVSTPIEPASEKIDEPVAEAAKLEESKEPTLKGVPENVAEESKPQDSEPFEESAPVAESAPIESSTVAEAQSLSTEVNDDITKSPAAPEPIEV